MFIGNRDYTYEEAQKEGYFVSMSREEFDKRTKETFERMVSSSVWSKEVQIDKHGLIWTEGKVFVNLFKCFFDVYRAEKFYPLRDNSLWNSECPDGV